MIYVVFLLNRLSHSTLKGKTPIEVSMGYTPDISVLLCFYWYQPVIYLEFESSFPKSKERLGRFVGISENCGDALTFRILTDETKEIISRSVVRPADDKQDPNRRLIKDGGGCHHFTQLLKVTLMQLIHPY